MSDQEKNILTFVIAAVIIGIFGVIIYRVLDAQEQERFLNTYGEQLISMCVNAPDNPRGSYANMPELPQFLVMEGDRKSDWHDELPENLRADTREEVKVVACVAPERDVFLESCPYEDNVYINRFARGHTVTLLNAANGRAITSFEVHGSAPTRCEDMTFAETGEVKERRGGQPDGQAFLLALNGALGY